MLVGLVVGLFVDTVRDRISKSENQRTVNLERGRTIPMIRRLPIILADGPNWAIGARPGYYPVGVTWWPFSLMIKPDRTVRMYGEMRNESGIIVVKADGGVIRVLPQGPYDINSDERAIEVVDERRRPVFQLRMLSRSQWDKSLDEAERRVLGEAQEVLQLNYVAVQDGVWQVVTPYVSKECGDSQEVESLRVCMIRIFEYPGHKYPGKRVLEANATSGQGSP